MIGACWGLMTAQLGVALRSSTCPRHASVTLLPCQLLGPPAPALKHMAISTKAVIFNLEALGHVAVLLPPICRAQCLRPRSLRLMC